MTNRTQIGNLSQWKICTIHTRKNNFLAKENGKLTIDNSHILYFFRLTHAVSSPRVGYFIMHSQVLILMIISLINAETLSSVQLPNFGFSAHRLGSLTNSRSEWSHVFKIPLLPFQDPPALPAFCQFDKAQYRNNKSMETHPLIMQCELFKNTLTGLIEQRKNIFRHIQQNQVFAREILPRESIIDPFLRYQRSVYSWLGIASTSDVQNLQNQIANLNKIDNIKLNKFKQAFNNLASFTKVEHIKLKNTIKSVERNNAKIQDINKNRSSDVPGTNMDAFRERFRMIAC